jgi:imidazolonepropionase-like amidohydrolase
MIAIALALVPIAITHVAVVDLEKGLLAPDRTVLVRDGRIESVGPSSGKPPKGATIVVGRGKFLIPGLWDMHVHLSWTTESALPMLVAHGVTGVRDLGSDLAQIDAWRAEIATGVRVGPRIVRAGPILNGRSFNRYQLVTAGPEQARGIVRALRQVGVDLIKVHRRVERDAYFAIADEAKKQGLPLVGHIPMTVSPEEASDQGQLIEHTETLFEGTFSAALKPEELPGAIARFRSEGADALFARFVRNHTPVTPALVPWLELLETPRAQKARDPRIRGSYDPRMRFVARSLRKAEPDAPSMTREELAVIERTFEEYRLVVGQMNRAGVELLAGTDLAADRLPGFSLHDELALMATSAGLTPLEALRTATSNPARVLKKESDFGSVAPGKLADLVLLKGNPLERIQNIGRIDAVILAGKLLRKPDLEALFKLGEEMASRN